MRIIAPILAAALCAGCQTDREEAFIAAAHCKDKDNDDECKIVVSISAGDCKVSIPDGQLTVGFKKGAKDKFIWWQIDPHSEWRFASNGIAPKSTTAGWNSNFTGPKRFNKDHTFRWKNQNKDDQSGSEYKYEITVINASDVVCKLDPIIRNQA